MKPAMLEAVMDVAPARGDRFSPNLHKWLRKYGTTEMVYGDPDGSLWIGDLEEASGWFHGVRLLRVLCVGQRAERAAHPPGMLSLTAIPEFWADYLRIGRCAIDRLHARMFIGDETRWSLSRDGERRSCLWCGDHTQILQRYWKPAEVEEWRSVA